MHRHIRAFSSVGIAVVVALFALLGSVAAAPHAATVNVAAKDFEFADKTVTISFGDTVTWTNEGQAPHTVTATDGSFDSGNLAPGATFSQAFAKAGTFAYYCKYHGKADGTGMAGTIVVQDASAAQPTAAPVAQQPAATGSLEANDQPVGSTVTVASVTAGQDGWVVIHLDENNAPGKVIGHTAIKKGNNKDVQVTLEASVAAGTKVWPMLHIDAGTIGTYEFPGPDAPVKDADGKVVMKQITLTGGQEVPAAPTAQQDSVEAENQPITNNSVTVKEVYASQDGWVVVHLDENNAPGKVIGHAAVKQGETNNLKITLDENVPAGGKVWPMLHIDAGTIGTYEFPGADTPVKSADGKVVMMQITITGGAGAPATLPNTGGDDGLPIVPIAGVAALLIGGLLALQARRRKA